MSKGSRNRSTNNTNYDKIQWVTIPDHPNSAAHTVPGSADAQNMGCICPVEDYSHRPKAIGVPYKVTKECVCHGYGEGR